MNNITYYKSSVRVMIVLGLFAIVALVVNVSVSAAATLTRQLQVGSTGSDVSALQMFLAQDATLYPQGLVTGYFGFLTKAAVSNFQSRNGIPAVGRVGPMTLPVINAQMTNGIGMMTSGIAPTISGVSINTNRNDATIGWNTNEVAKGVVYYSSTPLGLVEHFNSVDVSGAVAMTNTSLSTSQNIVVPNLSTDTVYYYLVYVTDQDGNVSVTWPSTFRTDN